MTRDICSAVTVGTFSTVCVKYRMMLGEQSKIKSVFEFHFKNAVKIEIRISAHEFNSVCTVRDYKCECLYVSINFNVLWTLVAERRPLKWKGSLFDR